MGYNDLLHIQNNKRLTSSFCLICLDLSCDLIRNKNEACKLISWWSKVTFPWFCFNKNISCRNRVVCIMMVDLISSSESSSSKFWSFSGSILFNILSNTRWKTTKIKYSKHILQYMQHFNYNMNLTIHNQHHFEFLIKTSFHSKTACILKRNIEIMYILLIVCFSLYYLWTLSNFVSLKWMIGKSVMHYIMRI